MMNALRSLRRFIPVLLLSWAMLPLAQAGMPEDLKHLQDRWAEINYQLEGKTQLSAFEELINEVTQLTASNPRAAEAWIWSGIIKSTYAGAKGGLGALSLAKESKADLERALTLNAEALQGSAYTSLGALYYSVPGWPIGFGDDEQAETLLRKALTLNPDGIDSNYFYGSFLITEKRFEESRRYLQKALQAAPRPGRALADSGRRDEIRVALDSIEDE